MWLTQIWACGEARTAALAQYMMMAINDTFPLLERAVHNPGAIVKEFELEVERLLEEVRCACRCRPRLCAHRALLASFGCHGGGGALISGEGPDATEHCGPARQGH